MKESDLPHITFEVTTKNMTDLIQTTCNVRPDGVWSRLLSKNPERIDTYIGTLHNICCLADEVVADMGTYVYSLTRRNCQHFCNKLLIKMKIRTTPFPTTLGADIAEPDDARSTFDRFNVVLQNVIDTAIDIAPNAVAAGTTALAEFVGAPGPTPHTPDSLSNLKRMYNILNPLAPNWKEIGREITTNEETLNKIENDQQGNQLHCLREMGFSRK
jgi:hypothetical protein